MITTIASMLKQLSILSRFDFYYMTLTKEDMVSLFQSYQGSIFTRWWLTNHLDQDTFNPIKVRFLLSRRSSTDSQTSSFNPIKVRFLRLQSSPLRTVPYSFNPIKVRFLLSVITTRSGGRKLSILSRFDFYIISQPLGYRPEYLSILSRFDFYCKWGDITPKISCFQSYQGSIFTPRPSYRCQLRSSFNPIKVRFLLCRIRMQPLSDRLSILSRFDFYWN